MLGRITSDGRLSGRIKYDIFDWLGVKTHMQLSNEAGQSQVMGDVDVKGRDWNAQLKLGSPSFVGLNYFQSITPHLSAGGEFFWLHSGLKSGVGLAVRHTGEKHVGTLQAATTGILSMGYAHKVTDKITLASDFLWHMGSKEATATVGFDCMLRQCRLRGKIDTNGLISTYIEERFAPGINFLLSAEVDHAHGNHRFGFGVSAGE
jgi:mitochondrial import receptor subunit TOM40